MSAGLFAIFNFGGETDLYPLLHYGVKAMSNRGDVTSVYILRGGRVEKIDVSPESGKAVGQAAVGCVYVEDCCVETEGGVVCKFGPEEVSIGDKPQNTVYTALTRDGVVYLYRPPNFWHLALGAHGFDFLIAATESSAIEVLGGEVRRSLGGGELLKVWQYGVESSGGSTLGPLCAMEYIYASRLDSEIDGVEVAEVRSRLATALAEKVEADVDIVVGVPETGVYYASWLARGLGRWCFPAFVATARGRSALLDEIRERLAVIQLKANVVESVVRGKRVLVVDDSLISGLTIKQISQLLRGKAGAREVHISIASPPLRRKCPHGVKTPPESHMIYNFLDGDKIPAALEVDSLTHLTVEEVERAVGRRVCLSCFL